MKKIRLEKRVNTVGDGDDVGWGRTLLQLTDEGLRTRKRSFSLLGHYERFIPFSDIKQVFWGKIWAVPMPSLGPQKEQEGILVVRHPQKMFRPTLSFITGNYTAQWVDAIKTLFPVDCMDQVTHVFPFVDQAMGYDLSEEFSDPKLTLRTVTQSSILLSKRYFILSDIALMSCFWIRWACVESVVTPETTLRILDDAMFDYVNDRLSKPVGFLMKTGAKQIPAYKVVDKGCSFIKKVIMVEDFFRRPGALLVRFSKNRQVESSTLSLGEDKDDVIFWMGKWALKSCLGAMKQYMVGCAEE